MAMFEQASIGELTVETILGGGVHPRFSKVFYLDPVNGSDGNSGKSPAQARKSLSAGYALLTANKNEALFWLPGASYITVAAGFSWAKAYSHFIGLAGATVYGGRCRMYDSAAFAEALFTVAAHGCIFKGIHWQRNYDSATGVANVTVGASTNDASYSYFEDCQVDGPIMASLGAAAYRNLTLYDGCRSTTFRRCTIGAWNQVAASTSGYQLYAPGTAGYGYAGDHFIDCTFLWYGNAAGITPIRINHLGDVNCYMVFDNCKFWGVGTAINSLFYGDPTQGSIILSDCKSIGVSEWISGSASHIFVSNSFTGSLAAGITVSNFS
jgi:hypothetical protein